MNRETAEHVAELAALLARQNYAIQPLDPGDPSQHERIIPCPPHVAAREAMALAAISHAAHRFAERQCNEDLTDAQTDRAHARHRDKAAAILSRFSLVGSFQWDPRGWPLAIHASQVDADSWDHCGSPRELLRVTPHA